VHGVPDRAYPTAARILRRCATRVVAVSDGVAGRIVHAGYPAAKVRVIENGVTPMRPPDRAAARDRLGLPATAPVAVCIARLVPQKRHDLLVAAWRDVPADALLLLAGAGPTEVRIRQQAARAGLAGRVRLLGERRDIDVLLAAADVAVLPTDWEGLPISLLEAMSADVPIVASAVPELVSTLTGVAELVPTGSADALAAGLRRVLTDRDHAAKLRAAGRQAARTRYGIPRMQEAYLRCFTEVLATEEMSA
jgi:glycosyltransferase involved in cell wall biosynthesis